MYEFLYSGYYTTSHSWAVVARNVCKALHEKGHRVSVQSTNGTGGLSRFHKDLISTTVKNPIWISYTVPLRLKLAHNFDTKLLIWNFESSTLPENFAKYMNRMATCVLPASNAVKNIFIDNGVDENKIRVLPYGVDLDVFNPNAKPLHDKSDKFTFVINSIPHHRKGLDIALEAFAQEFRSNKDVRLIVKTQLIPRNAPVRPFQISLVKFKADLQKKYGSSLPEIIYDENFYEDHLVGGIYTSGHAYISPSRFEGFGMTMLEAMACGVPVITSNYSAMIDYCTEENSYLINTKEIDAGKHLQYWKARDGKVGEPDIEHFRHLMREVYNNYDLAKQKAKVALEKTIPNYTWGRVTDVITNFLDEHMKNKDRVHNRSSVIKPSKANSSQNENERKSLEDRKKERRVQIMDRINKSSQRAKDKINKRARAETQKRRDAVKKEAVIQRMMSKKEITETKNDIGVSGSKKNTISSHTILLNEEENIVGLLNNIYPVFDEIVLVDTGSTDRTVDLIQSFLDPYNKIKFYTIPKKNSVKFGGGWNQSEQRNFAISKCTSDWVFMIDADERLQHRFRTMIDSLVVSGRANAFAFPRYNYWKSPEHVRVDRYWKPNYSYRLWKRKLNIKYENRERHCQPQMHKVGYPNVLSTRNITNNGLYFNIPIHHIKYINIKKEENGLYRANERDVSSLEELEKGSIVAKVPSVFSIIESESLLTHVDDPVCLTRSYIDNEEGVSDGFPTVDIVIPVYNNFHLVKRLLKAIDADKSYPIRNIIIVNDCSNLDCYNKLNAIKGVRVLNNPVNIGFTGTSNIGMKTSDSDYMVLLNSDTIPSKGWLKKIIECGESSEKIGVVGPISNAAMNQSVPVRWENNNILPDNITVDEAGEMLESISQKKYPRVLFANGFCYVVKKDVMNSIGYFDEENFSGGYVEEEDYSMRVRDAGYEIAIADDAYVHHDRCSSYGQSKRNALVKSHLAKAKQKWGKRFDREVRKFTQRDPLQYLREEVKEWVQLNILKDRKNKFRINFIAPHFKVSGGVKRIKTIAEYLHERGHNTRILIMDDVREWDNVSVPVEHIGKKLNENSIPDADFTVCHADGPCHELQKLSSRKGQVVLMHMHHGVHEPKQERENLKLPFDRWATSDWLVDLCKSNNLNVTKLGFAIDRRQFYPMDRTSPKNEIVIGTLYHGVPWKGFDDAKNALIATAKHFNSQGRKVKIYILSRHNLKKQKYRELRHYAEVVVNPPQDELRKMYSDCDVWLCASWKEGIGMTSVEAMACKTAVVTSDTIGSRDYAIDGDTALVSSARNWKVLAQNLIRILEDEPLKNRIAQNGYDKVTSWKWSDIISNIEEYLYTTFEKNNK